jgi:hypothetical protein
VFVCFFFHLFIGSFNHLFIYSSDSECSHHNSNRYFQELANIVLGIILYNREQGNGGAALPNSRDMFFSQSEKINRDLEDRLTAIDAELDHAHNLIE